jgi:hypothetical protein
VIFEACTNKTGSVPAKFEEVLLAFFPKGKGERREERLSAALYVIVISLVPKFELLVSLSLEENKDHSR